MRKLFWLLPIFCGLLIGVVKPIESASTSWYTVLMLPPSGFGGQHIALTCGWHEGSCGTGSGNYLDWDNTDTRNVYFRGFFTRAGAPYEINKLRGDRRSIQSGPDDCEIRDVDIRHVATNALIGTMRYVHMELNTANSFQIPTYSSGQFSSRWIGTMVLSDSGKRCPWKGTHVHSGYTSIGQGSRTKNTARFPGGDYCTPGINCKTYRNDLTTSWTHKIMWYGS